MLHFSKEQTNSISKDWLISRSFLFKVHGSDAVISEQFTFHKNGFIVGYSHPNEAFWEMDGPFVNILDQNGAITCQLTPQVDDNTRIRLTGFFRGQMQANAETQNLHIFEEGHSDYHAQIQSFDIFDTLIARRCHDPLEIFAIVERKSGVVNFGMARHRAEMSIFGRRPYGIQDVYDILVAHALLTPEQAKLLMLMEMEEEWENLFPIGEMIARVDTNDILISDMYLPYEFIERVIREKCGLENKIYLSNYGKHHREIWPVVQKEYKLRGHFGDNINADIVSPSEFGIPVNYVQISKWDRTEEILHEAGLAPYAYAVREARLQAFSTNVHVHNSVKAQLSINIPLMILGSFWVRLCAEKRGADKILMASRDCNLWHEMLSSRHFAKTRMPSSTYVQISRLVSYYGTVEYDAYFQSKLGMQNLLVDVVGTGHSLAHAIGRMGRQQTIHPLVLVGEPETIGVDDNPTEALATKEFHHYRIFLEVLNASLEGSAAGAVVERSTLKVVNKPNENSEAVRNIIAEMRGAFENFLTILDRFDPPAELPSLAALQIAADAICELIPGQAAKLHVLNDEQRQHLALTAAPAA